VVDKRKLIAIVGPTASGKTKLAADLAQRVDGEVIGADSRQVYRYMDIGTAKPTAQEQAAARHHLLDVVEPDGAFSLGRWLELANEALEDIWLCGKQPLLVGGTGQYVWALLEGWRVPSVPPQDGLRAELESREARELVEELRRVDPEAQAIEVDGTELPPPFVVGVRVLGVLPAGTTATDLVLTLTQMLRAHGVVGRFVEFFGSGCTTLELADRATLSNMCPEYGATAALWPVDDETLRYLRFTGREDRVDLIAFGRTVCGPAERGQGVRLGLDDQIGPRQRPAFRQRVEAGDGVGDLGGRVLGLPARRCDVGTARGDRGADAHEGAGVAGHAAAHPQQITLRINQIHPQVLRADSHRAHVARPALAFENPSRRRSRAARPGRPFTIGRAVGFWLPAEMVAPDDPSEPTPFTDPDDVHPVPNLEHSYRKFGPFVELLHVLDPEFAQVAQRRGTAAFQVAQLAAAQPFRFGHPEAELHSRIPFAGGPADLSHDTRAGLDQRHRNGRPGVIKNLGHSQFPADKSLHR